jgi:hypothetical protein
MNTLSIWYILCAPAWFCILLSAAARLADMEMHLRPPTILKFFGLIGAGVSAVAILSLPFTTPVGTYQTSWRVALVGWSWFIVWAMVGPPWLDMVLGVHRDVDKWKGKGLLVRLRGELKAIADSFRPPRGRLPQ